MRKLSPEATRTTAAVAASYPKPSATARNAAVAAWRGSGCLAATTARCNTSSHWPRSGANRLAKRGASKPNSEHASATQKMTTPACSGSL